MLKNLSHVYHRFKNYSVTALRQPQYLTRFMRSVDWNIWIKEVYRWSLKTVSINPWINRKGLEQRKQTLSHIFDDDLSRLWFNGFFVKLWNSQRGVTLLKNYDTRITNKNTKTLFLIGDSVLRCFKRYQWSTTRYSKKGLVLRHLDRELCTAIPN